MSYTYYIDAADLITRAQAGVVAAGWNGTGAVPSDAFKYLNHLLETDNRIITNNKIRGEVLNSLVHLDAIVLNEWFNSHPPGLEVHNFPDEELERFAGDDGGELSLIETSRTTGFTPSGTAKFLSGDAKFVTEYTTQPTLQEVKAALEDAGYGPDNLRGSIEFYGEQSLRAVRAGNDVLADTHFNNGMLFEKDALSAGRNLKQIYGFNPSPDSFFDRAGRVFKAIAADEGGYMTVSGFNDLNWSNLTGYMKANGVRIAGEAVGVAAVLLDSWETKQELGRALADNDLRRADELLGGLIGRSFGGAFGGALLGATWGAYAGWPGMIIGGIIGGILGATGGGEIGEWLFGELHDAGRYLADFLAQQLADLLATIQDDPLVLDLDGDGIELTALSSSTTYFDIDGDGYAERVGWVSSHDGLLVHDHDNDGQVDGIDELFGSANIDGYDELLLLDSNSDGKISAVDTHFSELRVWRDLNQDGESSSNEIQTLTASGILELGLSYSTVNSEEAENTIARLGSYKRVDGVVRQMASVQLSLDNAEPVLQIPAGADVDNLGLLPNLPAANSMPDLRTAMYFDSTLKEMVENFIYENHSIDKFSEFAGFTGVYTGEWNEAEATFLEIIYRWTDVDMEAPFDPLNPRFYHVLEKISGTPLEVTNQHQRDELISLWSSTVRSYAVSFIVQAVNYSKLSPLIDVANSVSSLSPDDPDYLDDLEDIGSGFIEGNVNFVYHNSYLSLFEGLHFDPQTGQISGDIQEVVNRFAEEQPSFFNGGYEWLGGVLITDWYMWFLEQGSILYTVGNLMNIDEEYIQNILGFSWMKGRYSQVDGTSGNDLIDPSSTTAGDGVSAQFQQFVEVGGNTAEQMIFGHEGDDELRGNSGRDRLIGGIGNDLLKGGSDSDMYIYGYGDGLDLIDDTAGTADAIFFSSELDRTSFDVVRVGTTNDLLLHFGDPASGIRLKNQLLSSSAAIEVFQFVGESTLDAGDIATIYLSHLSTSGTDSITGTWAGETIRGLAGNDTLLGAGGNDVLEGGDGVDSLNGGDGMDRLHGDAGNDTLVGGDGSDTIIGGSGNDTLTGGSGIDTYIYDLGDGDDIIFDASDDGSPDETLMFGEGISTTSIIFSRVTSDWDDIRISFIASAGSIIFDEQMGDSGVESIVFADGTTWSEATLLARYVSDQQTSGNDTINGTELDDVVEAGAGNDVVVTGPGDDTIIGGTGNDTLTGGSNADTYIYSLGDGDDVIFDASDDSAPDETVILGAGITTANIVFSRVTSDWDDLRISFAGSAGSIIFDEQMQNSGIEKIIFADGTIWNEVTLLARYVSDQQTSGNDTINGTDLDDTVSAGAGNDTVTTGGGDDTIAGGTGNDTLTGGAGVDTYIYNLGDGDDIIFDASDDSAPDETVIFGAGITTSNIVFSRVTADWDDLRISFVGSAGSIIFDEQMQDSGIEKIIFADGTVWNEATLLARYVSDQQTSGNDTINGTDLDDTVSAGAGNDTITTGGGDDTITGGTGNDTLQGGTNVDTYVYNLGDGDDVIFDNSDDSSPDETLVFGAGITTSNIVLSRVVGDWYDIRISFVGYAGSIIFDEQMRDSGIERIEFADSTVWDEVALFARYVSDQQTSGNDTIYGTNLADTVIAGAGNDSVLSGGGNDVLMGGLGNDVLNGESGTDWVDYSDRTTSVTVSLATTAAQTVASGESDTISGIENLLGGSGNDTLTGSTGVNHLKGGDGDDRLTGGAGNDTVEGGSGTDIAVYAGLQASYTVATNSGVVTVKDNQTSTDGNDGTDTIIGIETLEFKGGVQVGVTSPIILDLAGDGIVTIMADDSSARFDLNGDGSLDRTSWISEADGFLFLDRNGDGTVTNAGEISFVDDLPGAPSDLAGLKAFDSNGDDELSEGDARFSAFRIWNDRNGDGDAGVEEILTLAQAGVASIKLSAAATEASWDMGDVIVVGIGSYTRTDGSVMELYDAALTYWG